MNAELRDRIAARCLQIALPVVAVGAGLLLVAYLATVPEQWQRLAPIGILAAGTVAAWTARAKAGPRPAMITLTVTTGAAIVVGMAMNGGVRTPASHATVVLVVLAGAWQGRRALALTVAAIAGGGGLFLVAEHAGWIPGPRPLPAVPVWASVVIFVLVTAGLTYIQTSLLEGALERHERDAAELLRARERLLEAEKMESLGRLAGGVAHDFNNMLAGVLGSAEVLKADLAGNATPRQREMLDLIRGSAQRAADLTRSLLLYARKVPMDLRPVDLNAIARSAAALLSAGLDRRITLEVKADAPDAVVSGSAGHLENAAINLGMNARDALAGAGKLTVSTSLLVLTGREADLVPGPLPAGTYAALSVEDTGPGIAPSVRPRIFEPFFTTKEPGRGTGLGLAGVLGTAERHGGAVRVESEPGQGCRFTILLPSRKGATPEPIPAVPAPGPGAGRILFVDDEEALRSLGSRILTDAGYAVETASDGAEALRKAEAQPGGYDLVLVDLTMPVMSGRDFCAALRRGGSEVPVVAMTGYLEAEAREALARAGVTRVLEKPYGASSLTAVAAEFRRRIP